MVRKTWTKCGENVRDDGCAVSIWRCDMFRYDLIPPKGVEAVAAACAEGASKYSPYNWERGMGAADILNHALRHVYKFLDGDRSEDHLGHAAWNFMAAIHSLELWPELNDGSFRTGNCEAPTK